MLSQTEDFGRFYRQQRRELKSVVRRLDASDADDVLQEALTLAWQGRFRVRDGAKIDGWLYVITARRRAALARAMARRDALRERWSACCPKQQASNLGTKLDVQRALQELPEQQRTALCLARVHGFELREIADQLGVSLSTTKRRIADAETKLRYLLG